MAMQERTRGLEVEEATEVDAAGERGVGRRKLLVAPRIVGFHRGLQLRDRHGVVHVHLRFRPVWFGRGMGHMGESSMQA